MVKKGQHIRIIGGDLFLAVCLTILVGQDGSVHSPDHGKDRIKSAGFGHFLTSRRLVYLDNLTPSHEDLANSALFDLILVRTSDYIESMKEHLAPGGCVFDFYDVRRIWSEQTEQ